MSTLFTPISLRGLTLANRIMVSPMCQYSADDGSATDWHFTHINNLALSGAAMFCIEATHVEAIGRITQGCLGLYSDANEAALKPILASRAKTFESRGGDAARACRPQGLQRAPLGGRPANSARRARRLAGGGAVGCRRTRRARRAPAALDDAGLARIRDAFVASAKRAERLGIDALELHGAHGYLLHQFLSPISNKRTDKYGGSLENRMRYPLEVYDAVRAAFPSAKPIGVRVSSTDWVDGGWDLPQTIAFANELKKRGADWIDASSGGVSPLQKIALGPGYQVPFAQAIREATGAHHDGGRPDHRAAAGRGHRRPGEGRHGRAGARHAVRPALGLARRGRAARRGDGAAAILALAALQPEGAVRRHHIRSAMISP